MKEITFRVKGSSKEPYEVLFIRDGNSLTAICNCPAGQFSNVCKHRLAILDGKTAGIVSDNANEVGTVVGWLAGTDVEAALAELRQLEGQEDADAAALKDARRKLARAMNS